MAHVTIDTQGLLSLEAKTAIIKVIEHYHETIYNDNGRMSVSDFLDAYVELNQVQITDELIGIGRGLDQDAVAKVAAELVQTSDDPFAAAGQMLTKITNAITEVTRETRG